MKRKKIYVVMGPTASGKSRFSLDLAHALGGEIINADSMQVYEDVPILTARPDPLEMEGVPHHLYGFLDAFAHGSFVEWGEKVKPLLESIDVPIVVGGTGLYLRSLIDGFASIPDIPPEIRTRVRQMPIEELRAALPDFPFQDPQRLMRALEVLQATGKPITYWQQQPHTYLYDGDFTTILIQPPRAQLYSQCNYRFHRMTELGAFKQVLDLLKKNPTMSGGVFKAIGVQEMISCSRGEISLNRAVYQAIKNTCAYAKRQETWFRHQIRADVTLEKGDLSLYMPDIR